MFSLPWLNHSRNGKGPRGQRQVAATHGRGRRALIVVEDLPVPFDRRVWTEAKTLRDEGWKVHVICPKGDGARRWHERIDGIEIYRYPLPTTAAGLLNHLAEYAVAIPATFILALLVRLRGKIDVIHACNPPDFFFPMAWIFKRLGTAFVFDQHDLAPEIYVAQGGRSGGLLHRVLLWSEKQTYRAADAVMATNETYRRFAIERGRVDPARVFVVRSSPDLERIHRVQSRPELKDGREFLVVYLGTMGPQDGVDMFLQAARCVADQRVGVVRFVAIGGGNQLVALRQMAHDLRLDGDVTFTGRVSDEVLRDYLSTADVGVSPDPANGFNEFCTMNKTLEYMASGVPVVAFDLEETRVSGGNAAMYVTPNSPRALGDAIVQLLDDPDRRVRMREEGLRRILGPLSWRTSAMNLLNAYATAVGERVEPAAVDERVAVPVEVPVTVGVHVAPTDADGASNGKAGVHVAPASGRGSEADNLSVGPGRRKRFRRH